MCLVSHVISKSPTSRLIREDQGLEAHEYLQAISQVHGGRQLCFTGRAHGTPSKVLPAGI